MSCGLPLASDEKHLLTMQFCRPRPGEPRARDPGSRESRGLGLSSLQQSVSGKCENR